MKFKRYRHIKRPQPTSEAIKITQEELAIWRKNPVTIALFDRLDDQVDEIFQNWINMKYVNQKKQSAIYTAYCNFSMCIQDPDFLAAYLIEGSGEAQEDVGFF